MTDTPPPNAPDSPTGPAVGQDEWVARHGEHRVTRGGRLGLVEARLRALPWWSWLALFVCVVALLALSDDGQGAGRAEKASLAQDRAEGHEVAEVHGVTSLFLILESY